MIEFSVLISGSSSYPHAAVAWINEKIRELKMRTLKIKTSVGYAPEDLVTIKDMAEEAQKLFIKVLKDRCSSMSEDQLRAAGELGVLLIKIGNL